MERLKRMKMSYLDNELRKISPEAIFSSHHPIMMGACVDLALDFPNDLAIFSQVFVPVHLFCPILYDMHYAHNYEGTWKD